MAYRKGPSGTWRQDAQPKNEPSAGRLPELGKGGPRKSSPSGNGAQGAALASPAAPGSNIPVAETVKPTAA